MNVDYAARFAGLSSDTLFALEYPKGVDGPVDCDAPRDYVEQLLVVLADWRRELMEKGVAGVYTPEGREYTRCLDAVREAWLQNSFRWIGGPELPYPFDLPAVTR